jgi:nucleoside-diphosphate-sugar epimerase
LQRSPIAGVSNIRAFVQRGSHGSVPSHVELAEGDVRDIQTLTDACRDVDLVVHAAGVLHVRQTSDWYAVNAGGTQNLAKAALQNRVRRIVLISSNAAAGRASNSHSLLTENDEPRPLSHYGRSKLLAERALLSVPSSQMETVVLRPCMFYGPPVPERHVDVYRRIAKGAMPLVGHGQFARSVTYIDHLVDACRRALTRPEAVGETFFVSDARVYTTRTVLEAIADALGVPNRFIPLPRVIAPMAYRLDVSLAALGIYWQTLHLVGEADWNVGVTSDKARTLLGYNPTVDLEEGMRRAVEWCKATGRLPA